MALVHAAIGVGEAVITGLVLRFMLLRRPDLLEPEEGADDVPPGSALVGPTGGRRIGDRAGGRGVPRAVRLGCTRRPGVRGRASRFPERRMPAAPIPSPMADYQLKLPGLDYVSSGDGDGGARRDPGRLRLRLGPGTRPARRARIAKGSRRMRLDRIERHSAGSGPLHRLDARLKLVAAVIFVVVVVATPAGWWGFGRKDCSSPSLIGLAGIPPRELRGAGWASSSSSAS